LSNKENTLDLGKGFQHIMPLEKQKREYFRKTNSIFGFF